MPVKTESNRLGDLLKYELEPNYNREVVTVLAGSGADRALTLGMVLGKITKGAAASAAVAGNTGDGAITAAPTVGKEAKVGKYVLTCIKAVADGGLFLVEDPDGIVIGEATVGVEFTKHLTFTIADGAADFIVGDQFTITVAEGSGKVVQIDFAATNGANLAHGVLLADVTAPDGVDTEAVALVNGPAILADDAIVWPAGALAADKTAALATLKVKEIKTATSA